MGNTQQREKKDPILPKFTMTFETYVERAHRDIFASWLYLSEIERLNLISDKDIETLKTITETRRRTFYTLVIPTTFIMTNWLSINRRKLNMRLTRGYYSRSIFLRDNLFILLWISIIYNSTADYYNSKYRVPLLEIADKPLQKPMYGKYREFYYTHMYKGKDLQQYLDIIEKEKASKASQEESLSTFAERPSFFPEERENQSRSFDESNRRAKFSEPSRDVLSTDDQNK